MREIKFRAWNKKEKFLDTAWSIDFEHGEVCHRAHNMSDLDDCILMQYTGLEDINDVEIYEGDVAALLVISTITVNLEIAMVDGVFSVINIPRGYGFRDTKYRLDELVHQGRIEVIGNIYENKELLEVNE